MTPFWKEFKFSIRQDFRKYTLFEKCNNDAQLILMLVASLVVKAIFSNQINFFSNVIKILAPTIMYDHDLHTVYPGLMKKNRLSKEEEREITYLEAFKNLKIRSDELMAAMYVDPKTVISFRNTMKALDSKKLPKIDGSLRKLGIKIID